MARVVTHCDMCGVSIAGMPAWSGGRREYCDPCYELIEHAIADARRERRRHRDRGEPEPTSAEIGTRSVVAWQRCTADLGLVLTEAESERRLLPYSRAWVAAWKRRRGRAPVAEGQGSSTVAVRLPDALRARLDARVEADGATPSDVVREALDRHLA